MSARAERPALTSRTTSLYDYALFRHGIEPDGRIPSRGFPLPGEFPEIDEDDELEWGPAEAAVGEVLAPLLADPDTGRAAETAHLRLAALPIEPATVHRITYWIGRRLAPDDPVTGTARCLARRLARTGTHPAAVHAGMGLLIRLGEAEDVPLLRTLGMLEDFADPAVEALDRIDRHAAALVWLTRRSDDPRVRQLIDAVTREDSAAVRDLLLPRSGAAADPPPAPWPVPVARLAEVVRLDGLLRTYPQDTALVGLAARLLATMADTFVHGPRFPDYSRPMPLYEAVVAGAHRLVPDLDAHATLVSLAVDLYCGAGAVLDWPPGRREELLDALGGLLDRPAWAAVAARAAEGGGGEVGDVLRARWIRRTGRRPFARRGGPDPFRLEVVVTDPAVRGLVETRILADGLPLVASLFPIGVGEHPRALLDRGLLRAGAEPREVKLAWPHCGEGCCGALHVTIRREGHHVVWDGWQGVQGPQPGALRFDAVAYDAELSRAAQDREWEWQAHTTALLIAQGLRDRPEVLAAWDCGDVSAHPAWDDPGTVVVSFRHGPGLGSGTQVPDGPRLSFEWLVPDDGSPPQAQADSAIRRLAAGDPRFLADLRHARREDAEALGFPWPGEEEA
ncbi:hypothetical protein [Streptomyces sp. fd1-xmd]|uniref:hypothetical protein n=1 Tax=Streptomyces sp. fd1-xmd TaxID=1812480 RepID=UPI0009909590|nr:hypothetical protein [Streptomyces sp. fd1-xmd]AQT72949.1 hypothetical protein B1K54_15945 [Streptomyces sp. fd1-xmd]